MNTRPGRVPRSRPLDVNPRRRSCTRRPGRSSAGQSTCRSTRNTGEPRERERHHQVHSGAVPPAVPRGLRVRPPPCGSPTCSGPASGSPTTSRASSPSSSAGPCPINRSACSARRTGARLPLRRRRRRRASNGPPHAPRPWARCSTSGTTSASRCAEIAELRRRRRERRVGRDACRGRPYATRSTSVRTSATRRRPSGCSAGPRETTFAGGHRPDGGLLSCAPRPVPVRTRGPARSIPPSRSSTSPCAAALKPELSTAIAEVARESASTCSAPDRRVRGRARGLLRASPCRGGRLGHRRVAPVARSAMEIGPGDEVHRPGHHRGAHHGRGRGNRRDARCSSTWERATAGIDPAAAAAAVTEAHTGGRARAPVRPALSVMPDLGVPCWKTPRRPTAPSIRRGRRRPRPTPSIRPRTSGGSPTAVPWSRTTRGVAANAAPAARPTRGGDAYGAHGVSGNARLSEIEAAALRIGLRGSRPTTRTAGTSPPRTRPLRPTSPGRPRTRVTCTTCASPRCPIAPPGGRSRHSPRGSTTGALTRQVRLPGVRPRHVPGSGGVAPPIAYRSRASRSSPTTRSRRCVADPVSNPAVVVGLHVLPLYNDEATIALDGEPRPGARRPGGRRQEVIVIDDGSSRRLPARAEDSTDGEARACRLVTHEQNRGYGGALLSGFARRRAVGLLHRRRRAVRPGRDRGARGPAIRPGRRRPGLQVAAGRQHDAAVIRSTYHRSVSMAFGLKIRDTDCDFRLIRREKIDARRARAHLRGDHGGARPQAPGHGGPDTEVPVHHYRRVFGKSEFFKVPAVTYTITDLAGSGSQLVPFRPGSAADPDASRCASSGDAARQPPREVVPNGEVVAASARGVPPRRGAADVAVEGAALDVGLGVGPSRAAGPDRRPPSSGRGGDEERVRVGRAVAARRPAASTRAARELGASVRGGSRARSCRGRASATSNAGSMTSTVPPGRHARPARRRAARSSSTSRAR